MFEVLFTAPWNWLLIGMLLPGSCFAAMRGYRWVRKGLSSNLYPDNTLHFVRGIRGGIVAVALELLAAGIFFQTSWLILFGCFFLLEELFETGVMIAAHKAYQK